MEFVCTFVQDFQAKKRHVTFANFNAMPCDFDHPSLCYCTDIQGLFQKIGIAYSPSDWRFLLAVLSKA